MGFLKKWHDYWGNRDDRRRESYGKLVRSNRAIRDDRVAAIGYFMSLDDPDTVVPMLLQRFDFSLEHGIFDEKEKDMCMEGILQFGDKAVPHLRKHLLKSPHIAWPIKMLSRLTSQETLIEDLKSCLDYGEIDFDEALVDRNFDILCYLHDYKLPGFTPKLLHFLEDHDERVRFACVELLLRQDDPEIPTLLARYLMDDSAENRRLRRAAIDAFLEHGWKVPNPEMIPGGVVEYGVTLGPDQQLHRQEHVPDAPTEMFT